MTVFSSHSSYNLLFNRSSLTSFFHFLQNIGGFFKERLYFILLFRSQSADHQFPVLHPLHRRHHFQVPDNIDFEYFGSHLRRLKRRFLLLQKAVVLYFHFATWLASCFIWSSSPSQVPCPWVCSLATAFRASDKFGDAFLYSLTGPYHHLISLQ
jgi:hypothetical protein